MEKQYPKVKVYNRNVLGGVCWLCQFLYKEGSGFWCMAETSRHGKSNRLSVEFIEQGDTHVEFCDMRKPVVEVK